MHVQGLIRYGSYPAVMLSTALMVLAVAGDALPAWPTLAAVSAAGIACVALLERLQPYERVWLRDHGDLRADVLHGLANLMLLAGTAYALHALRGTLLVASLWPTQWPVVFQLLLAGAIVDVGLYTMHRVSHRYVWAWRLHAIHHSAERLYWLNGERRHPLSALLMAGPSIGVLVALGAPPQVLSAWLALLSVQLAFQHANLDYRVGPLRRWLGVAEVHRWHHKRDYEDAQVNFGEFFMLWDRLFGTFHDRPEPLAADAVGLREEAMPSGYLAQLIWPFRVTPDRRSRAFAQRLAAGYAAMRAGDAERAYALFEEAHVLGQARTVSHLRSHWAFLCWSVRFGDRRETLGQGPRLLAAALFTWLWMPRGNTGGARIGAFLTRPIVPALQAYMEEPAR
ncbi:sterol desaturase family protein [Thermomonas sp.]|uniref:sterol desaturase family protein n=1 Tax=Thermomonas sp. TaxID=1971895 RepID=UPI00262B7C0E|nr:sterol desaturase family protein [Thermomonas sp.]